MELFFSEYPTLDSWAQIWPGELDLVLSPGIISSRGLTVRLSEGVCGLCGDMGLNEGGTSHGEGGTEMERGISKVTLKEEESVKLGPV